MERSEATHVLYIYIVYPYNHASSPLAIDIHLYVLSIMGGICWTRDIPFHYKKKTKIYFWNDQHKKKQRTENVSPVLIIYQDIIEWNIHWNISYMCLHSRRILKICLKTWTCLFSHKTTPTAIYENIFLYFQINGYRDIFCKKNARNSENRS